MKNLYVFLIFFFIFIQNSFSQDLREYELEKNIKTFFALPTDSQYLDVICNEIDTLSNKPLYYTDSLFWNAAMCIFTNSNDTAVVISRTKTKHLVILRNVYWRNKKDRNYLKYFKN